MIREKLAAYKDAVGESSDTVRYRLTSEQAIALLDELDGVKLTHAEKAAVAKTALAAVGEASAGMDGQLAHAVRLGAALTLLWEALEGQVIDGVTITRKQ